MSKYCGITFKDNGKIYFFDKKDFNLTVGDKVIVDTEKGKQFGKVIIDDVKVVDDNGNIKEVIKIATKDDEERYYKNLDDAQDAIVKAKELAKKLELNMSFTDANFNFDRTQLIFSFVSDTRVDFRELAKELASLYKTRIELRQIGVRDKAKELSGIGQCGRELCCASFLNDLDSVSINMAKNQNLALNPTKINGQCGRLLCCLKYEDDLYFESKKGLPNVGNKVTTDEGEGKVISVNILKRKYNVQLENGNVVEIVVPKEDDINE